jgi:hypothetical protein
MQKTIIGALEEIAQRIGGGPGPEDWFKNVQVGKEQLLVRYATGPGEFTKDGKYVVLDFKMYDLSGNEDGYLNAVFEARYPATDPSSLFKWVKAPEPPPSDKPSPVQDVFIEGYTKETWTFADNSSVTAVGPTLATVAQYKDGSSQLFVRSAYAITGGTGRFTGTLGGIVAIGSSYAEPGKKVGPGTKFNGRAIECIRVIKEGDVTNTERV